MATRNLSQKFLSLRASSRSVRLTKLNATPATLDSFGAQPAMGEAVHETRPEPEQGTPEWVVIHENTVKNLASIKDNIRTLSKLHTTRLKVSFGEAVVAEQQSGIDNLTHEITASLRTCEAQLKQIGSIGNISTLTAQERTTRLNVMRSLGAELAQASKHFRHIQKDFFRSLRDQEKIGEQFFSSSDGASVSLEDAVNNGLTPAQAAELQLIEQKATDREKEIIKIAQSVNELATLFKELNMLVIEQGTVLDRIDYNIDQSLVKIKKGVVDLEEAEKESKKALAMKCVVLLGIICFLLLIVFIWKKSSS